MSVVGAKGRDKVSKSRKLLTRAEKLILLRIALFDDDEGGFGAERDVTRWVAPFMVFQREGLDLTIEFAHGQSLVGPELNDLIELSSTFCREVEESAGREWHEEDRLDFLTEDAARFLLVRDAAGALVGVVHFRFTLHGELADVMEGEPTLFVYDLLLQPAVQRKGLGRHLMVALELIARRANMCEMLMPVPKSDLAEPVRGFLGKLPGWAQDDLLDISERIANALDDDGTLEVYTKVLVPRRVQVAVEPASEPMPPKRAADAAAAPNGSDETAPPTVGQSAEVEAEAGDDWVVTAPAAPSPSGKKRNRKGKGGKGKGKAGKPGPAAAAPPSECVEVIDLS